MLSLRSRRSLPAPSLSEGNLRRSNSSEQLTSKRGRKRRNSESNSEGILDLDSEKKPRLNLAPAIDEGLNSSEESAKSNDSPVSIIIIKLQISRLLALSITLATFIFAILIFAFFLSETVFKSAGI